MAAIIGTIKVDILARAGKGEPIVIGTTEVPIHAVRSPRIPRANKRVRMGVRLPPTPTVPVPVQPPS